MNINTQVPTIYGGMAEKLSGLWSKQIQMVKEKFGSELESVFTPSDYPTDVPILFIKKDSIVEVLRFFKEEKDFDYQFLADLTATDEQTEFRFEIVCQLFSLSTKSRIRLKVKVRESEEVPTVTGLWKAANWLEREVFDMFGVRFAGHPDLRRILMDERWQGHPLRKDYPLRGYQIFPTAQEINPALLEEIKKDH